MKKIKFIPISENVTSIINPPIPASRLIPEWYKHQKAMLTPTLQLQEDGNPSTTIKKCMPVLDDMTSGYYITLASDLIVSWNHEDNAPGFSWSLDTAGDQNINGERDNLPPIISGHSREQISQMPVPGEYSPFPKKFSNYYRIVTPSGYSCLFRHPSYWMDLPFYTLSGIVDTDKHPVPVNFPFLIRAGWEGLIPEGTPIVQFIPFRRTEWESEVIYGDNREGSLEYRRATKKIMHRYKDNWRSRKLWK